MTNAVIPESMTDLLAEPITIATGKNKEDKQWKNVSADFGFLIKALTDHEAGKKDGKSYMQGSLVDPSSGKKGTQRIANNVVRLDLLVLDMDTGQPMEEVRDRIRDEGLMAIIYSTHSHLTTETAIVHQELVKKLKLDESDDITPAVVRRYLEVFKRYDKRITASITHESQLEKKQVEGGIRIFVTHAPMPKYRIVFILAEPFVIAKEAHTQREAIEKWKRKYAGAAQMLGAFYDRSCVDPSRLFYFPRHAAGTETHFVEVIDGDYLDLSTVRDGDTSGFGAGGAENAFLEASKGAGGGYEGQNKWVKGWWYRNKAQFQFADFAESYSEVRQRYSSDRICICCPNDDSHSNAGDTSDVGFFCVNAGDDSGSNDGSAFAKCMHDSCINQFGEQANASWPYLDLMVTQNGLKEEDLDSFVLELYSETNEGPGASSSASKASEVTSNTSENAPVTSKEQPAQSDLNPEISPKSPAGELMAKAVLLPRDGDADAETVIAARQKFLRKVVRAVADGEVDKLFADPIIEKVAKHFGIRKPLVLAEYRELQVSYSREQAEENAGRTEVNIDAPFKSVVAGMFDAIKENNDPPSLFRGVDGTSLVRLAGYEGGHRTIMPLNRDNVGAELTDMVPFYKEVGAEKVRKGVAAPPDVVSYVMGLRKEMMPVPELKSLIKHPIFGVTGEYYAKPGYNLETSTFMVLDWIPKAPPRRVTEKDLEDAWDWIFAKPDMTDVNADRCGLYGEFPFGGPGDENGNISRINWLMCMLAGLMKEIITTPIPPFVISKPSPGAGASLLVNLMSIILMGRPAASISYTNNIEEFAKTLSGKLTYDSTGLMFYDNVNCKVDNGDFASATSQTVYEGRKLGTSTILNLPCRLTWVMTGNNMTFSSEIVRRFVTVSLDPQTASPEERNTFRIRNPLKWAEEHRADLFRALTIFILKWVQDGMPRGDLYHKTYEDWAAVCSGIEIACDFQYLSRGDGKLLGNAKDSNDQQTDLVVGEDDQIVVACLEEFGDKVFTTADFMKMRWDSDTRTLEGIELEMTMREVSSPVTSMGRRFMKMRNKTYKVDFGGKEVKVAFKPKGKRANKSLFQCVIFEE